MSIEHDERVKFYLRNRVQIETWASLRDEAAKGMDDWLEGLGPRLEVLATKLDGSPELRADITHAEYPSYRFVDPRWGFRDDKDPRASVALEWVRGHVLLRGRQMPYVGLRCPDMVPANAGLRERAAPVQKQHRDLASRWWAAYRHVAPPSDFPDRPEAYAQAIVDAVTAAWALYAPLVGREDGAGE